MQLLVIFYKNYIILKPSRLIENIFRNNFIKFILKSLSMPFKMYSIILILISIFTISINSVFGDSDFVLELQNVNTVQ